MNIEYNPRIELGYLVRFIAEAKNLSYREAENLIPGVYFEGCHLCDDEGGEWAKECVEYLKSKGIDAVEVYQEI